MTTKSYSVNGQRVAQARQAGSAAWAWTWYHSDHLQSATVLADNNGNVVRRLAYKAFGEEIVNTGSGDAPPYTYTGKERDSSGLLYITARGMMTRRLGASSRRIRSLTPERRG